MKKQLISESQFNIILEALLLESKLGEKAWQIAKKYFPILTEPRDSDNGMQTYKPILNETHIERIVKELNDNQAYSTHALNWLLLLIVTGDKHGMVNRASQLFEDLDIYARYIRKFDENKQKIIADGHKPDLWSQSGSEKILNYKSKEDLYQVIKPYFKAEKGDSDLIYPMVKHYVELGDFEYVGETNTWYIVKIIPGHEDAVIAIQRGPSPDKAKEYTTWCTRVAGTNYETYMRQAPLFMLINKHTAKTNNRTSDPKSMLQFHWGITKQFRDREDMPYDPNENASSLTKFFNDYPDVYPIFFQGVIDVIMDPDTIPLFPVSINKTSISPKLIAMYKYKLDTVIKTELSKTFNVSDDDITIIEYGSNGIILSIRNGERYDAVLNKTLKITSDYVLMPADRADIFFEGQKFTINKLEEIQGLITKNSPTTWIPFIDPKKFRIVIDQLLHDEINPDLESVITDVAYSLRGSASIVDIFTKLSYEIKKGLIAPVVLTPTRARQQFFDLLRDKEIINNDEVKKQITNPAKVSIGIQIIPTNIILDVYVGNFSEGGLTMENFKANSKKTKMSLLKTKTKK